MMIEVGSAFKVTQLVRGGLLVESGGFLLQIGSYPETIKDTMQTESGVPDLILVPDDLFDVGCGLSIAEIEFPVYYNFFIKKRKTRVICREDQADAVLAVINQSIFGPREIDLTPEYVDIARARGIPDLKKEMDFYRLYPHVNGGYLLLEHVLELITFDAHDRAEVDGVSLYALGGNGYSIERGSSRQTVRFKPLCTPPESGRMPAASDGGFYKPPLFGITVIGSGHGFDASARTAGFIIWIDGKGILVDPPVHTTVWLRENGINTRLIEDIILTHCHADHDGGTLQKILEESRIRVHTTRTILKNFIDKYSGLLGLSGSALKSLFQFEPVLIDLPVSILGARFKFKYSFHSIPTIGFNASFGGKSFVYSADTLNDPALMEDVARKGIISRERMNDLLNFPWDGTVIFHEAGIPPIHTPISTLAGLPEDVKERIYLVHVSDEALRAAGSLKKAMPGLKETIGIEVEKPKTSMAQRMLDLLSRVELFRGMRIKRALEFLSMAQYTEYSPGDFLIKKGSEGDRFFMILSGEVELVMEGLPERLVHSSYDYIGDTAIILDQPRNADAIARTHVEVLSLDRPDFLHFIRNTGIAAKCRRMAGNRSKGARWLFEKNRITRELSGRQQNELLGIMHARRYPRGAFIAASGEVAGSYFWIDSGSVIVGGAGECEVRRAKNGDILGTFSIRQGGGVYTCDVACETDTTLYSIRSIEMKAFLLHNPGVYLKLLALNRKLFI